MPKPLTIEVLVRPDDRRRAMEEDVRAGLSAARKSIPPVWFYDEVGSRLFDEITRLPEYYLTRAERSILAERAGEIAEGSGADTLVEIGSGTSEKTRLLLDAMQASGRLDRIVLLDISEEVLVEAAHELSETYEVAVHAVVGDLRSDLTRLPSRGRQLWCFLGSTIGNFEPRSRADLLFHFSEAMGPADHLLLGTDLIKDVDRLVAAYDDAQGVTAAFNRNVLRVLDNELGADFDPDAFDHKAVWNPNGNWIEMRLVSRRAQHVAIKALDVVFEVAEGEEILTEISSKFDPGAVSAELEMCGLQSRAAWLDGGRDFLLTLAGRTR